MFTKCLLFYLLFILFARLNTNVEVGDIVHIHADWYESFNEDLETVLLAIIDRTSGLIVVKPDLLVSGTSVVSSLFCCRKAVLSERFRGTSPTNQVMLNGTLVHRLLQKVIFKVKHFCIQIFKYLLLGINRKII